MRDRISLDRARVFSEVGQNAVGQSGEIRIATGALELTNGADISSSTWNKGNAGNVVIQARDSVVIKGGIAPDGEILYSSVLNRVQQGAVGQSGEIRIDARSLELTGAARISAGTSGTGDAGNIILNVSDRFSSNGTGSSNGAGIFSQVFPRAKGQGGEIRIATDTLKLTNASQVSSATFGTGNAGNVEINARNSVVIQSGGFLADGRIALSGIFSTVEEKAVGRGGKISIDTGTLQLTGGSRITSITYSDGNAGNVGIKARDSVIIQDGIFLDTSLSSWGGIFSRVEKGASGQGGELRFNPKFT